PPLLEEYMHLRRTTPIPLLPGVKEALAAGAKLGLKMAVVSNNPQAEVDAILKTAGIHASFNAVIGNDLVINGQKLRKKPAPDFYLHGCTTLGITPQHAAVFEDSALGCQAGIKAGCHVVGLLTGSASLTELHTLQPKPAQILPNLLEPPA
ncbi:MAG TPA: HAD family phosphatase, partial [Alphaproteobacteria bacterium]|nr:HAD family phosphatase [Alphaproteobacteria bacterium]